MRNPFKFGKEVSGYQFYERNIKIANGSGIFDFSQTAKEIHLQRLVKTGRKSTLSERATMAGGQGKKHKLAPHQLTLSQPITDEETTEIGSAAHHERITCLRKSLYRIWFTVTGVGQGPYACYPGKSELSEYGIWQVDRDGLYFPGNRQRVEMIAFTDKTGRGVVIVPQSPSDISVETDGNRTIVSVNAVVSSPYNKNVWPTGTIRLDRVYPLPEYKVYEVDNLNALLRLKPSVCDVHHFYHAYDR